MTWVRIRLLELALLDVRWCLWNLIENHGGAHDDVPYLLRKRVRIERRLYELKKG